ncbi:helix-turn-helix transcriptional regulator [Dactylosporangium sp. AC04546]|uniref:helix-turn-helix domain-containing protein n=1 Tax=Dactylosporangium sp. AC04546 TaxID=2862460 RepID=UPI001EDE55D1|nr:helix-turn-helix transcriptional regulator [Dactylosporangium sp. AC04546]WVK78893.1 helix-turn-helix transcriptional regulator [Dactylosporangium sp. AC04546]
MPIEPTPAIGEARAALAARLREIRVDAGVTAIDLARRAAWPRSKVSKIEHARQTPTADDIRVWCEHAGALDQAADLIATRHALEGMWVELRRLQRTGLRHFQDSFVPLWERTRQFRVYEAGVIPGLFQTSAYARARMRRIIEFNGIPDDLEQAVQARMDRQRVVYTGDHTFAVVLEENALFARIGDTNMMAAQLAHLITIAVLPNVSLGIIPRDTDRTMWASPGFWIYDDERVIVETPSAQLTITQPREVALYARTFVELSSMAVVGSAARRIIADAIGQQAD